MHCDRQSEQPHHHTNLITSSLTTSAAARSLRRARVLGLIGALLLALLTVSAARAQTDERAPAYWQHDASARVDDVSLVDIDKDGFVEFVIAANTQVDVVRGDGELQWSVTLPSSGLRTAGLNVSAESPRHLLVAGAEHAMLFDSNGEPLWDAPLELKAPAVAVAALDHDGDGRDAALILLRYGALLLLDQDGDEIWRYVGNDDVAHDAVPQLLLADLDRDERDDIVYSYFDPRGFSRIVHVGPDGERQWERIVEGFANALVPVAFDDTTPQSVGVGTSRGRVHLFSAEGREQWPRTLNTAVTSMALVDLADEAGPLLAVGTNLGRLVLYDADGRRVWDKLLCAAEETRLIDSAESAESRCAAAPDSRIAAIDAAPSGDTRHPVVLLVTYTSGSATASDSANILAVTPSGDTLAQYLSNSPPGLSRLIDLNHDDVIELLLTSFSTVELLSPATDRRQNVESVEEWPFRLRARPTAALAIDVDADGHDELFIGTSDGRLLRLRDNGVADWVTTLGGDVLALHFLNAEEQGNPLAYIVAGSNRAAPNDESATGELSLFGLDTETVWREPVALDGALTALTVADVAQNQPVIVAGTDTGNIVAIDRTGSVLWQDMVDGPVTEAVVLRGTGPTTGSGDTLERIVLSYPNGVVSYDRVGRKQVDYDRLAAPPVDAGAAGDVCDSTADLLTLLNVGGPSETICLDRSLALWEELLGRSRDWTVIQTDTFSYAPSGLRQWQQAELIGGVQDRVSAEFDNVVSVYRGDITGDGREDVALASGDGTVFLDLSDGSQSTVEVTSPILHATGLTGPNVAPGLLVTTDNGLVSFYRFQPNYPPLVTSLGIENDEGNNSYSLGMAILDAEDDAVDVTLELFDPEAGAWVAQPPAQASESSIFWSIDAPQADDVQYQVNYSEGAHEGAIRPNVALSAAPVEAQPGFPFALLWLLVPVAVVGGVIAWRQTRSPQARVQRFYRRLAQSPQRTLPLVEAEYNRSAGSPDFLLALANTARNQGNQGVAGLADGLFLLANRPSAAISIINTTLAAIAGRSTNVWDQFDLWQALYRTTDKLLGATSMSAIVFQESRLHELLDLLKAAGREDSRFSHLAPIVGSLNGSERVESADDRLAYLNEAVVLLRRLNIRLRDWQPTMETRLLQPVASRWMGLVTAEIESVRGHARIWVTLKTTNIAPSAETTLALEVKNVGRAPAEEVTVRLEERAYCVNGHEQDVPFLAPGRSREVAFAVRPPNEEQFRVSFQVEYSDRNARHKLFEYANVVNVLRPVADYQPILNPYAPGTPLRKNSPLFFGRRDLFQFIAEEAERLAQQRVLILVGQRRTGKTSALLRLEEYLPPNLLPVYVDCQSLGIISGMTAFFHDVAWLVADALENRGIALDVPEAETIAHKPAHWFQREFLPQALDLLPEQDTIVLAFDEFEALENLVNDGILPPQFFTYLRHMMQHGNGMSFIFAGTHRLEEMTSDYWSVLFNIALYKEVGYLSRKAAEQVATEPVAPHIRWDDLALDKLWRLTAGHPYFLQLVCYTLVKRANQERTGYVTISDINAAVEEMIQLGEVHFAYIWQQSSREEKLVLGAVAHVVERDTPIRSAEIVQALEPYGIVMEPTKTTAALNRLTQRNIMRAISDGPTVSYQGNIGLVFSWVAQTKGLNQLYET